ncbi:unnamed protein product [Arabidopsis thaliana]|uniref:Ubiquitin-like superfamily protein n=2 Tax=Arabidopsis thaliana TaxID=3702 RepID=Q9ZV64_ARATH|nr:Ubiquitin-like superfamily protein [Arabidopsis thaliana]AAC69942.1 hypothetical protein [Arabidopsis thaliana]AEC08673.1 Ubiquitin-like superfamily protein [Arabidopsis thaliana]VYS54205.1 unnamed protein product [Arabidopsis thaliana]|eukprot:NP_180795.1 Ubiquitin-like superfamily protein [Arabidopsis thaliana]
MKVSVEIITGTFIDTDVSEDATVKQMKEKIAVEVKLPVTRLILVIGDEETRRLVMEDEDDMMLRDLGVGEDSHIYLFFKHPDLVSKEERSKGEDDDDPMEEVSSEAESGRGNEEEVEKAKIDGEEEDQAMKDEEEDRDVKVEEDEEEKEKEKDGEAKYVKEEAREVEEADNKQEN